jgi:SNF2 family DNA or RNA helicase
LDDLGDAHDTPGGNPKLDALSEWTDQFGGGGKFVIVAVNKHAVKLCCDRLTKDGLNVITLYGDSPLTVDEAKNQFNSDDSIDGIIISVKKGGVGLTLLGSAKRPCSDMCFFQTSWSLIDRLQVIDRIHRIGQRYPCNYTDIVSSPLDREIVRRLNDKEELVDAVMDFLEWKL